MVEPIFPLPNSPDGYQAAIDKNATYQAIIEEIMRPINPWPIPPELPHEISAPNSAGISLQKISYNHIISKSFIDSLRNVGANKEFLKKIEKHNERYFSQGYRDWTLSEREYIEFLENRVLQLEWERKSIFVRCYLIMRKKIPILAEIIVSWMTSVTENTGPE